jgi:hypothetical protein
MYKRNNMSHGDVKKYRKRIVGGKMESNAPFGTKKPVSPNDKKVQRRFDIAHLVNCEHRISKVRLQAYSRLQPYQSNRPSGQENL